MTLLELDFGVTLDEDLADDEDTLPDSTLDEDVFPCLSGAETGLLDSPLHATNKTAEDNNVAKYFKENLLEPQNNRFSSNLKYLPQGRRWLLHQQTKKAPSRSQEHFQNLYKDYLARSR